MFGIHETHVAVNFNFDTAVIDHLEKPEGQNQIREPCCQLSTVHKCP